MGNYSSAVVTMVPGGDTLPQGAQVYRARVSTPPAWRRQTRPRSRPRPTVSAPLPLTPIREVDEASAAGGGDGGVGRRRGLEWHDSLERALGRLDIVLSQHSPQERDSSQDRLSSQDGLSSQERSFSQERDSSQDLSTALTPDRESEDSWEWIAPPVSAAAGRPATPAPQSRGRLFLVQGTERRRRPVERRGSSAVRRQAESRRDAQESRHDAAVPGERPEPGHLLVQLRREERHAVRHWYLPWLRDGYLESGDEEQPPDDDSDDDSRQLSRLAAERADTTGHTPPRTLHAVRWQAPAPNYATIEYHDSPAASPDPVTGPERDLTSVPTRDRDLTHDPTPAPAREPTPVPTRDLTEVILRRGRSAEAVRAEAGLVDARSEQCKERCIEHYLEMFCSSDTAAVAAAAAAPWDPAWGGGCRRSVCLAAGAPEGPITTALQAMDQCRLVDACLLLQASHQVLRQRGAGLRSQVAGLSGAGDALEVQATQLRAKLKASEAEAALTKEALAALKADRKRLKAEKFDLLNQMKQLYQTLEDKERELRDFIRNYELRIKENDESLRTLAAERDETEREKWNILKHARDETERSVGLSAELSNKDGQLKHITEELTGLKKQLSQLGYYSDHDSAKPSRPPPPAPPAAAPALSPGGGVPPPALSPAALGTPNGRGSSADSGVRVSSDRDSVAAGTSGNLSDSTTSGEGTTIGYCVTGCAGIPVAGVEAVPTDYDSISMVSSVTACSPYYYYAPVDGQRGSPTTSPLTLSHAVDLSAISKSAEQLDTLDQLDRKLRPKGAKQGTWGSISRVFSRQKQRKQMHMAAHPNDEQWSPHSSLCSSPLTDESYTEKLRLLEEAQQLPMERWKASMVLAWLQVTLGMPQYGPACAENVRSGKVMLELTDLDLERVLGILQPMHKKKLRLAIEELRQPHLCKYPYISQLNHGWVAAEWLPDIGLPHYSETFSAQLMDGRMLAHLSRKDMERHLGVTRKFHQVSMLHAIQLLRLLQFDRQNICERRQRSELSGDDALVWTNARFVNWVHSIDLSEYADNIKDSGVHGALVVLELTFTADTMATALGIPQSKTMIRRHLAAEMDKLVRPARLRLDEGVRYARWEQDRRRQERPTAAPAPASASSSVTLGRPFSRSYGSGLQRSSDKEKRGSSLRGSLSRALGLKAVRSEPSEREPVYETPRGVPAPAAVAAAAAAPRPGPLPDRPQSVVTLGGEPRAAGEKQHRRVKSISDMDTLSVTPV